jgi:hypothetical protein
MNASTPAATSARRRAPTARPSISVAATVSRAW